MKNIILTRIDDRLIHGQVMTQWVRFRHFNTILIIDDATARDSFLSDIATMAVPSEFTSHVYTVDKAAEYLAEESKGEEILILVKGIDTIDRLINKGIDIKEVNVGGMGMKSGRKSIYRNIAITDTEKEMFKKLIDKGIKIFVQIVPTDVAMNIDTLF